MSPTPQTVRQRLEEAIGDLERQSAASAEARAPVMLDPQSVGRLSRMDALQMQAMADAQERQRAHERTRLQAALTRLEAGAYGYCLACDEEIGDKRLAVDPAATHCIACAGGNRR